MTSPRLLVVSLVSVSVVLAGACVGCAPKKDKELPKPTVFTTPAPAPSAAPTVAAATAVALPKLGQAPAWKLKDLQGNVVSSEQFKGKVVVVDFWATWCGPCRAEIPGYVAMLKKYEKDGLVVVGISLDEAGLDVVQGFVKKFNVSYPIVMGDEAAQTAFGGIQVLPTTFLIDRQGQVRDRKDGALESAEYEKRVLAVLNEKSS